MRPVSLWADRATRRIRFECWHPAVAVTWLAALVAGIVCAGSGEPAWGQTGAKPESGRSKGLSWVRVTEHAPWKKRDSSGEVVLNGKMWLLGGWFSSYGPFPNDVWSSADGVHWTLVSPAAGWVHADLPTTVVHDGKMWIMGGWANGRLAGASASNQVWCSADGAKWQQATAAAAWSPRLGAGGTVHNGKMWILGGVEQYFFGTKKDLLNDVWSSADGVRWEPATRNAPWAPRAFHAALAFDNKLWVMGGGNYLPTYEGHNDVWSSPDGAHWTRVTEKAPWPPRIWFSAVVYKNRMWVLGGWSNRPSANWNDVWYSSDGANWKQLNADNVWSKRHEHSAYVLDGKLWVAAGNAWPCTNDVWQLDIPDSWLEKH